MAVRKRKPRRVKRNTKAKSARLLQTVFLSVFLSYFLKSERPWRRRFEFDAAEVREALLPRSGR